MDELSSRTEGPGAINTGSLSEELRRAISLFPDLPWGVVESDFLNGTERELPTLRPESVGISNLLTLPPNASVLLWNWDGLAMGRHLLDLGHQTRFYDSRIEYEETARLLCGDDSIHSPTDPDSEIETPDVVFVGNTADDSESLFATLTKFLGNTLDKGGVVVATDSDSLLHPTSTALLAISTGVDSLCQESVLVLPNLDCPKLLIRENFLHESPGAWRHLASYVDELGAPRFSGSVPIREVWSLFEKHQRFPLQDVSKIQVLWRRDSAGGDPLDVDFIHQTVGTRLRQFWTETRKRRGQPNVERRPIFGGSQPGIRSQSPVAAFQHFRELEPYRAAQTIEDLWLSALHKNAQAEFDNLICSYFRFLQSQFELNGQREIDLNPDNLLRDSQGQIIPIAQSCQRVLRKDAS